MIKIFYKMKSLSARSLSIVITLIVIISMFVLTTYMRFEHNKKETNLERIKGSSPSIELVRIALEADKETSHGLYRKIWTYDALIFLSGAILIYAVKSKKE